MSKVSIIIPVYNVEKYLKRCLDSVVNQTYKDLEIICVNDCSSDNCHEILREYEQQDKRIRVVNREQNGGLSAARNTGLDNITGKYLYFIDSDDWIDSGYIEKMVKTIKNHNADIIINTNILIEFDDKSEPLIWERYSKQSENGEFLNKENAINKSHVMIWTHLYKKSFFDKYQLKFPVGYVHEDEYFQHISKIRADKIFVFYGDSYHYFRHNESIMGQIKNRTASYIRITKLVIDFYKTNNLANKYNIKLFSPLFMSEINTDVDFEDAKALINVLQYHISAQSYLYSDYEKFIINAIKTAKTLGDYKSITNK